MPFILKATGRPNSTRTRPGAAPFHTGGGRSVDVQMMNRTDKFGFAQTDDWKVLEMPYAGKDLDMVVLLPLNDAAEGKLTADEYSGLLGAIRQREVVVSLPKFKFEARYNLNGVLTSMGMPDAFALPPADFSGMTGQKNLYITGVIHQAVIEVNEEGSEAAAATAVVMGTKAVMERIPEFKADRPFIFLITHKPTGSIIFMGRVANPAQ